LALRLLPEFLPLPELVEFVMVREVMIRSMLVALVVLLPA
jgi:hypothetical protein